MVHGLTNQKDDGWSIFDPKTHAVNIQSCAQIYHAVRGDRDRIERNRSTTSGAADQVVCLSMGGAEIHPLGRILFMCGRGMEVIP